MSCTTIAVAGDPSLAREIAKKGTTSDITMHNLKHGDHAVTFVEPTRYPEKVATLAHSVHAADAALLSITGLTKEVGETILALDAAQVREGIVVLGQSLVWEQIAPLVKDTVVASYHRLPADRVQVREAILALRAPAREGPAKIPVDHHFPVKGVGTVALGVVARGAVHRHDQLQVFPTPSQAQVRSIQVHDADVEVASTGDRVGIALKGIENEDLDRGHVLAPPGSLLSLKRADRIVLSPKVNRFVKAKVSAGQVVHISVGMQLVPITIESGTLAAGESTEVRAALGTALALDSGERSLLWQLDGSAPRILGSAAVRPA